MSTAEPEIITQDREQLAYLLTEAAEIEHGLMCCYLFAAHSLKRGVEEGLSADEAAAVVRWRDAITSVAIDEMLHLALVSNLLTAIGSAPHFERPNFPVTPGYHPAGVVVSLAPFSLATLDHFIYLERPEGIEVPDGAGFDRPAPYERATKADRLTPSSQDYATVGHLYRGIRSGIVSLADRLGASKLFVAGARSQLDASLAPLDKLIAVTDVASALRAVDTIVEQGEGSPSNPEDSHFRRFITIRDEYRALLLARPDFEPAFPVAHNPVMRKPPVPQGKVHIDDPATVRVLDVGNAVYAFALRCLARAFAGADYEPETRRVFVDASLAAMHAISSIAQLLSRMPASENRRGLNAGLTFTMLRSAMGFAQPRAAASLLAERAREIATASLSIAKDGRPELATLATDLTAIATRLAGASPVAPPPAPRVSSPEPSPARAVEEARGEKLLLRFEGKRCIHSRNCVLGAPTVFLANVKGAWLHPDAIPVEELVAIAESCPSGAITYRRTDGAADETPPLINIVRIRENGPLAVHAQIRLDGHGDLFRATLCRCGASKNKPFCDGSHATLPFVASGEPTTQPNQPLATRNGPLTIRPTHDGPLDVTGNLEICSGTGRTITRIEHVRLCRCGGSSNKPFCDGTHARIGFRSEQTSGGVG